MANLPWKDEYKVNVAVMDAQHGRLADLVNQLHDTFDAEHTEQEVRESLSELIAFTRLHFATEEELMLKYAYPDYPAHQAAHKMVLDQMDKLANYLEEYPAISFGTEPDISQDWITKHLLESDAPLGRFLNSQGVF